MLCVCLLNLIYQKKNKEKKKQEWKQQTSSSWLLMSGFSKICLISSVRRCVGRAEMKLRRDDVGNPRPPPTSSALCCQPLWVDTNRSLGPIPDSPLSFWPNTGRSKSHREQWWPRHGSLSLDAPAHLPTLSVTLRWWSFLEVYTPVIIHFCGALHKFVQR